MGAHKDFPLQGQNLIHGKGLFDSWQACWLAWEYLVSRLTPYDITVAGA
jgi:hypothetical protein